MLNFNISEWVFVIINLVILVVILRAVLWKRVGRVIDERQKMIVRAVEDAEAVRVSKQALEDERIAHVEELDRQTAKQMQDARVRAGREYDRIISEAEEKSRTIISSAEAQGEREQAILLRSARSEVVAAALELTGALLGAQITAEKNAQLVELFLNKRFGAESATAKGAAP